MSYRFAWDDVLLVARPARREAADAAFELASAVEAAAVWLARRAAHLCQDARGGTSLEAATQACKVALWSDLGFHPRVCVAGAPRGAPVPGRVWRDQPGGGHPGIRSGPVE